MGNNNAISSVDLSNAYNGVSGYNAPVVGFLVFVSNWGAPIYWSLVGLQQLLARIDEVALEKESMKNEEEEKMEEKEEEKEEPDMPIRKQRKAMASQARTRTPSCPSGREVIDTDQAGRDTDAWEPYTQHIALLTLWVSVATTAVMFACAHLRTHLFVWSVFSPKFLMQVAWVLAWHLGVNVMLGTGWWWAGSATESREESRESVGHSFREDER